MKNMKKVAGTMACACCLVLLLGCNGQKKQVEMEWTVYRGATEHNDVTTAIGVLNRIVAIDRYNADALDTLSILYYRAGLDRSALKVANRAINIRESAEVMRVLAGANRNLGRFDQALTYYEKLLKERPDDLSLLYESAYALINLNRGNEALPYIRKMIAHAASGTTLMTERYQNATQQVPYKAVALNMLGFLQANNGEHEAAAESYRAALGVHPDYYLAKSNLQVLENNE